MPRRALLPGRASFLSAALALAALLAAGLALAAGPAELLPNGGFESGTTGWTAQEGSLAAVTSTVRSGARAGRLDASGASDSAWLRSDIVAVEAGSVCTLSGAVYFTDTRVAAAQLRLSWYESVTSATSLLPPAVTTPLVSPVAGWQSFPTRVATVPPGIGAVRVEAGIGLPGLAPARAFFDDLSLTGIPAGPPPAGSPTVTPAPTRTPTPTPTPTPLPTPAATWPPGGVVINEFLSAPHAIDWDGDGTAGSTDEWVELFNSLAITVSLGGGQLDDIAGAGSTPYLIPPGTLVGPLGYRLFFQRETGLALNNDGDTVRLLYPDGSVADEVAYTSTPYDRSHSRTASGAWTRDYPPSPGGPNLPPPTATPAPTAVPLPPPAQVPVGQARGAARDAAVIIQGQVTAPTGTFGRRVAYVQDGSGGIRIQEWGRDLPTLGEGDWVRVEGRLTTVYGEVTLNVREIARLGPGTPLPPETPATGVAGAWWEGRLVRLAGRVTRWDSDDIWLDDGSGPAQARLRESTGLERPPLAVGQFLGVTGVMGQSNGRWFVLPRRQSDLVTLPGTLPASGDAPPSP